MKDLQAKIDKVLNSKIAAMSEADKKERLETFNFSGNS